MFLMVFEERCCIVFETRLEPPGPPRYPTEYRLVLEWFDGQSPDDLNFLSPRFLSRSLCVLFLMMIKTSETHTTVEDKITYAVEYDIKNIIMNYDYNCKFTCVLL